MGSGHGWSQCAKGLRGFLKGSPSFKRSPEKVGGWAGKGQTLFLCNIIGPGTTRWEGDFLSTRRQVCVKSTWCWVVLCAVIPLIN